MIELNAGECAGDQDNMLCILSLSPQPRKFQVVEARLRWCWWSDQLSGTVSNVTSCTLASACRLLKVETSCKLLQELVFELPLLSLELSSFNMKGTPAFVCQLAHVVSQ